MPNRDHEDSQYDRNEGRFENREGRDEQNWREGSGRGSRDWDRRGDDFRRNQGREGYSAQGRQDPDYDSRAGRYGAEPERGYPQRYAGSSSGGYPQPGGYDERRDSRYGQDWGRPQQQSGYLGQSGYGPQQSGYLGPQHSGSYGPQQGGYFGSPQQGGPQQGYFAQGGYSGAQQPGSQPWQGGSQGGGYGQEWNRGFGQDYGRSQSNYGARDQGEPFADRGPSGRFQQRGRDDESWTEQVRHAGQQVASRVKRVFRGPKGYRRSDDRIREDVSDRLAQADDLDPSDIEVSVANGEVTLTGTVRSRREKFLAEEIADDVSGVNEVNAQLRIRREEPSQGTAGQAATAPSESAQRRNARA